MFIRAIQVRNKQPLFGLTIGKTEMIFVIDHAKDCAYYFKVADKSHIHITRRKTYLKSVSILENIRTTKPLIEEVELPELGTGIGLWVSVI